MMIHKYAPGVAGVADDGDADLGLGTALVVSEVGLDVGLMLGEIEIGLMLVDGVVEGENAEGKLGLGLVVGSAKDRLVGLDGGMPTRAGAGDACGAPATIVVGLFVMGLIMGLGDRSDGTGPAFDGVIEAAGACGGQVVASHVAPLKPPGNSCGSWELSPGATLCIAAGSKLHVLSHQYPVLGLLVSTKKTPFATF